MISMKMAAKGACLLAVLALGASNAEAKKYKHYGSSGSSSSHGESGSSSSHGSSGSSSSHGKSGSSSSHGSSGSSSSHGKSGSSSSHGSSGSSSSHGKSGSSSSHGSSGSSSSHGHVIVHPAPAATTSVRVQPATLLVKVPADATVYLMDQKMTLTGTERQYSIPVRQAGVDFTYKIRVEVVRDGKTLVSRSEQQVRAGQQYEVAVTEAVEDGELVAVAGR